jgi:Predicted AAA-ATPase.
VNGKQEVIVMNKVFNVSADCKPNLHYMVDMSGLLQKIKEFVDRGEYFTMNRARQYGKTTTLRALKRYLQGEYIVISLDFQKLGADSFENETIFSITFARYFLNTLEREKIDGLDEMKERMNELRENIRIENRIEKDHFSLFELFLSLSRICGASDQPVVLLIDEVDSASNNQVFLDFLAQLRGYYIDRDEVPTFQSVILAGVYDIRSLKAKIRTENAHKTNSPWNIAAEFDLDMSLPEEGIAGMLEEYERDYHTGMDIRKLSSLLYEYTSGYPFLVSRICKLIDEKIAGSLNFTDKKAAWTKEGFLAAVRILLMEENTLFESLDHKLEEYPELKKMLQDLLLKGKMIEYVPGDLGVRMAAMFGFITLVQGTAVVSNRIFETRLYNGFLAEKARHMEISQISSNEKNQFIVNGQLDMEKVIQKFVCHYTELFAEHNNRFLEDNGRSIFLLYMKPIINGTGNYYIESRTRTNQRTDLIIDFCGQQEIVELKIWHGDEYNRRGEEQLADYLESFHLKKGYLVSFNFNKKKQTGVRKVILGDKILIEAVVRKRK